MRTRLRVAVGVALLSVGKEQSCSLMIASTVCPRTGQPVVTVQLGSQAMRSDKRVGRS